MSGDATPEPMKGQDTASARQWERPVIALAFILAVAGIIVGSLTKQSAIAGGLIALAPVVVIGYQSVLTRLAVAVGQDEVNASLKQAEAASRQVDIARQQVDVAEMQLAALVRPVVVPGSRPSGHPLNGSDWGVYARPPTFERTGWRVGVVIRNVGSGPAFLDRILLGIENRPGAVCVGTWSEGGGVLPPQETVVADFYIDPDRPELRAIATILKATEVEPDFPLSEYRFVVTIDYRDLSNRNQPRTTLFLRNTGRQNWSVEAVRIDPPL